MRVTIEHREGERALLRNERAYFLDCSIDFSEEEKAVIARRGLGDHYIAMPPGYFAVLDQAEQRRVYGLKLAIASGLALFSLFMAPATNGHPIPAFGFFGAGGYAVFCLFRYLKPKALQHEQLTLDALIKHRSFTVQTVNPTRSKEIEEKILAAIENMKQFLEDSTDVAPRTVHEF